MKREKHPGAAARRASVVQGDVMQSLPLLWLSLAFVAGIALGRQVTLETRWWLALAGGALAAAIVARLLTVRRGRPLAVHLLLLPVALLLGAARYQAAQPALDPFFIAWYNDRPYDVLVTGYVDAPPDRRDSYTNLKLQVEFIDTGNESPLPCHGRLLARVDPDFDFRYGDRVRLRGSLRTPPENEEFSYRDYLARYGIHAYMSRATLTHLPGRGGNPLLAAVYAWKERALLNIYRLFPDPEAALLAGILLGVESGLPPNLQQDFKDTGTAHIIAISGFNIAIIAALFVAIFSRLLGPRRGALAAVAGIALYTLLVGAQASVVRAAIMGGLSIFARQVGRRQHGLNSLALVAAVMALFNPLVLWDVGFQLSFGATLGLILYASPMEAAATRLAERYVSGERAQQIAALLSENVLMTLAAQLTTLPIMAYHFRRISLVSLIANPFILAVQPPVMLVSGAAVLLSLIYFPLGQIAAWAAWPFSAYTIRAVEWFADLPHGVWILGDFSLLFVVLFYAILFALTFARQRVQPLLRPSLALTLLGLATILTWRAALFSADSRLRLTFLDVGSADAVLVQPPGRSALLINGGASATRLSDALGRRLPPPARLGWLIVAAPQESQISALPRVLERIPPSLTLWAGRRDASYAARELDAWLTAVRMPVVFAQPGTRLDLGRGAMLRVVASGPRGAVLLIEWGAFRALLPCGLSFETMEALEGGRAIGPVTLLLLADSGYAPANPPEWLAWLNPQVAVLSVAAGDAYGRPDQATLDALEGHLLLRTDRDGWIQVATDGRALWVETQR